MLPPGKLKTAQNVSMRSPILIKDHDENILQRIIIILFYFNSQPAVPLCQSLIYYFGIRPSLFCGGGRERDWSESMALSSTAIIWSLVKYLWILGFAVWSVPDLLLFTSSKNNIKKHFPTIGLKTKERQIKKMWLPWPSWKCQIPPLTYRYCIFFWNRGSCHSSAAEP